MGRSEEARIVIEIWGLTGGIASGKSTAAKFFADLGIPVVDADQISRALSAEGGAAHEAVMKRFGTTDRARLREIVFKDEQARKDLEGILHPHIIRKSQTELEQMAIQANSPIVIYEAALLIETGRYKSLKGLIVVESPRDIRKERLISRSHLTDEMAERILDAQLSNEKRRAAATLVIENSGTMDELRDKVRQIALASGWISD